MTTIKIQFVCGNVGEYDKKRTLRFFQTLNNCCEDTNNSDNIILPYEKYLFDELYHKCEQVTTNKMRELFDYLDCQIPEKLFDFVSKHQICGFLLI